MSRSHPLLARLIRTRAVPAETPDARLLADALARRDPAAFEALVARHGPTVWSVCRRLLRRPADAEDAFQAVFLVLLRSGPAIAELSSVGGWLYRVAYRTALKARLMTARRARRESAAARPEDVEPLPADDDTHAVVHDELAKLPDIYRLAVLLSDLEGLSRKDAAERLGWKEGTLSGRLNRGRKLLAARLRARGVAPVVAAGATVLPPAVAGATVALGLSELGFEGITRAVPPTVAALTRGVLNDMATRFVLKIVATAALILGTLAALGVGLTHGPKEPAASAAPVPKSQPVDPAKLTQEHLSLVSHQKIQKEMKLSPAARVGIIDTLAEIAEEELEAGRTAVAWGPRPAAAPAGPSKDFFALRQKAVARHLTADDFRRLRQIDWQLCGAVAFRETEVVVALGLTERQKAAITGAVKTMFKTLSGKGAGRQAVIPYWNEEEFPQLWTAARDTALEQLTPAQRKKWDALIGEKVSFEPTKHLRTFGHILNRFWEPAPEPTTPVAPGQAGGPGPLPPPAGGPPALPPLPPANQPPALPPAAPNALPPLPETGLPTPQAPDTGPSALPPLLPTLPPVGLPPPTP